MSNLIFADKELEYLLEYAKAKIMYSKLWENIVDEVAQEMIFRYYHKTEGELSLKDDDLKLLYKTIEKLSDDLHTNEAIKFYDGILNKLVVEMTKRNFCLKVEKGKISEIIRVNSSFSQGEYIFLTKSGTIYTIEITENRNTLKRNPTTSYLELRRDNEKIRIIGDFSIKSGDIGRFKLEPLGEGNYTIRTTNLVTSIYKLGNLD